MNREEFMHRLAEVIRPRSAQAGATILVKMLSFLSDLSDDAFSDEALRYIAPRLPRSPSVGQLRNALNAYLREHEPKPERDDEPSTLKERREHEQRQASLRDDWDDPAGILRKVNTCNTGGALGHRHLLLLAKVVGKFAPQHLGLLPPRIIEEVARDPECQLPVFVELRSRIGTVHPARGKWDQIDATTEAHQPRAMHLTREQLDIAYGRKRHETSPADYHPGSAKGLDENEASDPARC